MFSITNNMHFSPFSITRVVFRAAVGDSSQLPNSSHLEQLSLQSLRFIFPLWQVSGEKSCHLPSNLRHGQSSISTTQSSSSSSSSSPTSRRVRVAVEDSSVCLYRTISVSESDRAGAVVKEAMKKHGIKGDPSHYHLQLASRLNKRSRLSCDANVFYALGDTSILILCNNNHMGT
ncbi:Ral guanine nucleotide dissociation stimulator-like 1 [Geodia barretti]|uniref:Ral guanine nucleotide dissociation stimulator-like 1 n=1 Tax=Geodia barretti TaxID=519541 RepID=A0AA35WSS8_GEOBA|nr:Ral guanine nucleotide dissociation stimulator-like 1 [Geodia barretti]